MLVSHFVPCFNLHFSPDEIRPILAASSAANSSEVQLVTQSERHSKNRLPTKTELRANCEPIGPTKPDAGSPSPGELIRGESRVNRVGKREAAVKNAARTD